MFYNPSVANAYNVYRYVMFVILAVEKLRCWGDWEEEDFHYIMLSNRQAEGLPAQYILVGYHLLSSLSSLYDLKQKQVNFNWVSVKARGNGD